MLKTGDLEFERRGLVPGSLQLKTVVAVRFNEMSDAIRKLNDKSTSKMDHRAA